MNTLASTSQLSTDIHSQLPNLTTVPIYQYYAKNQDGGTKYFYSTRPDVQNGWTYETIQFYTFAQQTPGVVPVYQYYAVYADGSVKYHFSTNPDVRNNWKPDVATSWKQDPSSPAFYAYQSEQPFTQPVYQYYAPDQDGGMKYYYSTDPNGAKNGWKYDFIAFHVAIAKDPDFDFNLSNLAITDSRESKVTGNRVIQLGQPFSLSVDFTGSGNIFENVAKQQRPYQIEYLLEKIGPGPEVKLGSASGKLVPGKLSYSTPETQLAITNSQDFLQPGIYQVAAMVTIPGVVTSFISGLILEVFIGK